MIVIVDYKVGNLGSIRNMFRKIGANAEISSDPQRIAVAEKLVLPGVGAFDAGMENLNRSGLVPQLNERVLERGVPTLGICLGMQLMARTSSEGAQPGLGWLDAEVRRFEPANPALKVPHMGWNRVHAVRASALIAELPPEPRFYFVHSYYMACSNPGDVLLTCSYDLDFHAAVQYRNIYGVQFHPEKSHTFGMALLANFATRVN